MPMLPRKANPIEGAPDAYLAKALILAFALILLTSYHSISADLKALWLAGEFFARGDLANVYPAAQGRFTMLPPDAWSAFHGTAAEDGPLYPYLYPPLWAALASLFAPAVSLSAFVVCATLLNAGLIVGMILLAWRATGSTLRPSVFLTVAMLLVIITYVGFVAIIENQPQILVSFLIVLTIERVRHGRPWQAGAALALAASIKLYPAVFVLYLLASRQWRAAGWFAAVLAALVGASVALAGWPLHQQFIEVLRHISETVIVTPYSFGLAALVAQVGFPDELRLVVSPVAPEPGKAPYSWGLLWVGGLWTAAAKVAMLAVLSATTLAIWRGSEAARRRYLWPLGIGLVALFGPLTWSYSYLPMVAFVPVIVERLGPRRGGLLVAALTLPAFAPLNPIMAQLPWPLVPQQLFGTLSMAGFVVAFALLAREPRRKDRPRDAVFAA